MSLRCISKEKLLEAFKVEVEETCYHENGETKMVSRPTERAILADKMILLEETTLGEGSYGKVKGAFNLSNMQPVAVKIIDCSKLDKFIKDDCLPRELNIGARVEHENIIKMHMHFSEGIKTYIVLERAENGDLLTYLKEYSSPLPDDVCQLWMRQICEAIKYLHGENLAHRDLKLENILLDSDHNIKLCDFGFSKDLNKSSIKLSNTYCGTRVYAAPEVLRRIPYDPKKADIWSISVIFYCFLTNKMPFKDDSRIVDTQEEMNLYHFGRIPDVAETLVKWMFTFEWEYRPDIQQVLAHTYFF